MGEVLFAGGAYESGIKHDVAQQCVNLFSEVNEAKARVPIVLRRRPGLKAFASASGTETVAQGAVVMGGTLYKLATTDSSNALYSVTSDGTTTSLGTVAGSSFHIAGGKTHVVVVNGTTTSYVYSVAGGFSTVTLPYSATFVDYQDTYFLYTQASARAFFSSATEDPTSVNSLDISIASSAPDNLSRAFPTQGRLVLFGEERSETWRDEGQTTGTPYLLQDGLEFDRGCLSGRSIANVGANGVPYFLGNDKVVHRLVGTEPQRVSNHGVENFLSGLTLAQLQAAHGYGWVHRGHYLYVLMVNGRTWVYDATASEQMGQSLWHEYTTGEEDFVGSCLVHAYGKDLVLTDAGLVLELDSDTYTDNGTTIWCKRAMAPFVNERKPVFVSRLEAVCMVGQTSSLTTAPELSMRFSKDGGHTWSNRTQRSLGLAGNYEQRVVWRRQGRSETGRVYEFQYTADTDIALLALNAEAA